MVAAQSPRRWGGAHRRPAGPRESLVDLAMAMDELQRARAELADVEALPRFARERSRAMPGLLARLDLARRLLDDVLHRHRKERR